MNRRTLLGVLSSIPFCRNFLPKTTDPDIELYAYDGRDTKKFKLNKLYHMQALETHGYAVASSAFLRVRLNDVWQVIHESILVDRIGAYDAPVIGYTYSIRWMFRSSDDPNWNVVHSCTIPDVSYLDQARTILKHSFTDYKPEEDGDRYWHGCGSDRRYAIRTDGSVDKVR